MQGVRKHLTYANVMATLAMFAVLGGGAYAAKKIGSSDIKKNAVRSKHIKKNQVKSSDIKNSQVKSSDIKDSQVKSADIADGGIAGIDIANNALGGTQINENSLGKVPSATDADDAAEVTGTKVFAFDYSTGSPGQETTLVNQDSFVVKADCPSGASTTINVWIETKINDAQVRSFVHNGQGIGATSQVVDHLNVGQKFFLTDQGPEDVIGTLEYRNGFDVVSMQFQASRIIPLRTPVHTCHASGHVFLS